MIAAAAAGNAFIQSAQIHSKAGNRHEAATQFVDAANCYKKTDTNGNCLFDICTVQQTVRNISVCVEIVVCMISGEELFDINQKNLQAYALDENINSIIKNMYLGYFMLVV